MDWNKVGAIGSLGSFIVALMLFLAQVWPYPQWKAEHAQQAAVATSQPQPSAPSRNQTSGGASFPRSIVFFLIASLLLASLSIWGAWRRPQSDKRGSGKIESKLSIHSAVYGTGPANDTDVRTRLLVAPRDALIVPVTSEFFGCDPAPNKHKRLRVTYSYETPNRWTIERQEATYLFLPPDPEVSRLESVIAATGEGTHEIGPFTPLQNDALQLSVELLKFLKRLGPPPAPKYAAEDIDKMTSAQMKKLIEAEDGDFAEACEYYQGDGTLFIQTANAYSNKITAQWKRLLPWYQKVAASYALEFKDKVENMRNRLLLEGLTDEILLMPIEGKYGEKRVRNIAAKLWELAYKTGEKGVSSS